MKVDLFVSDECVEYCEAVEKMSSIVDGIINHNRRSVIWLLTHNDVYTAGASVKEADNSDILCREHNIPMYYTDRGGKCTYHGPGQRVAYLMLDLKALYNNKPDIRHFIYSVEEAVIRVLLEHFGITACRRKGFTGVWVMTDNSGGGSGGGSLLSKIAAIGIKIKKWVSYHGVAININPDLNLFSNIIPCGIKDASVTSVFEQGGQETDINQFDRYFIQSIQSIFNITLISTLDNKGHP